MCVYKYIIFRMEHNFFFFFVWNTILA
ncbi:hypothetical protein ACJIZ3_006402 [Penstemon smallii]|uniref:Uncharacterized protein n=1 Tax=Penstemon smallii TaxID=265156 RepID=A0ABD3S7Q1_9LAMI